LMPQLKKIFPKRIDTFVDLFCGGMTVSLNVKADRYIINDASKQMIRLYRFLQDHDEESIIESIYKTIDKYKLSRNAPSDAFLQLRRDYNRYRKIPHLICLMSSSFNNLIHFNTRGDFTEPFGERCFQKITEDRYRVLIRFLQDRNVLLTNCDFRNTPFCPSSGTFIYCDPPYSYTKANYNKYWDSRDDRDLLALLDSADNRGSRFALSCVLLHNNKSNNRIKDWADKKYKIHELDWLYSNCVYNKKDRITKGREVCITNY